MPLPTTQPRRIRPAGRSKSRPPVLWRDLAPEHQALVAHVLAVLVRRLHLQRQTEEAHVERA
jgi:hypothetical protein